MTDPVTVTPLRQRMIEDLTIRRFGEQTQRDYVTRAAAGNIVALDFVEAARLRGEGNSWIVFREVLPNIAGPLLAEVGARFSFIFLFISSLSFLGLRIQPPVADWGGMARESAALLAFGDITPLIPAGAIALLSISLNFVVDWLIDAKTGASS